MKKEIKILFIGIPDMASVCLDTLINSNKKVVGIVPPPKDHACFGIMKEKARLYNIPFFPYNLLSSNYFLKQLKNLKPDIGVVCSYDRLIPKKLLEIPKLGFLNVHPSLLPDYRGGNPYFHVIKNGERQTGVTIHFMDETFDTGDIVSQSIMPIGKYETMGTLFNKLNLQSSFMIVDIINLLEEGKELPRIKQDTMSDFKKAPSVDPAKGHTVIDWSWSCKEIDSFVRACNPFFATISYFRGEALRIYNIEYDEKQVPQKAGEIVEVTPDRFGIAAKDGVVYPKVVYFGSYAMFDDVSFVKVFAPKVGEVVV